MSKAYKKGEVIVDGPLDPCHKRNQFLEAENKRLRGIFEKLSQDYSMGAEKYRHIANEALSDQIKGDKS